ncbi:MAG TPA: lysophospholipid acyltransferase family protein [Bacteroidales bacterium]|nr:lysophospholipid acyltransferase family protein [Bacteroidales bacterium]HPF03878.1 lysophospholipid acyltransferase family protein [Bacteroidales bacterium]HPJ60455.1 lysophospholipid acyltransferase family protein [Bacteroidales bacterium]HPR12296.1 lysophospholipid acyltransferase family protein [Bacteroidales bacterium]HRW83852.1 lysophospholipid acyltransferase family protein [Bacteroidales bacterium]
MIYRASHHFFLYPFFRFYSVWKTRRNFREVKLTGDFDDRGLPLLVISNHFSWWDGFWTVYLNEKKFHRLFHFMMLEEQLLKNMFLNKSGGYSVKKGSRSIAETISYTTELLRDKKNMVLMFPQGEILSIHTPELRFEKGIEHIIKRCSSEIHILFLVNLIDYFSWAKPSLFMYFREYKGEDHSTITLENAYNRFYSECRMKNISIKGA